MAEFKKVNCSNCHKVLDANSGIDAKEPKPGDISICVNCAQVCIFKEDLTLRNITKKEMLDIEMNYPQTFHQIGLACIYILQRNKQN